MRARGAAATADAAPTPARRLRALAGAALVVAGAGALLLSTRTENVRVVERAGGNQPVNASAAIRADFSAHNSPTLVRDPRNPGNLAIANRVDAPRFACALHLSRDGGATWRQTAFPAPRGEERKCYAPDVAFDAAGTLYVTYVTLRGRGNVPNAMWIVRSRDGGRRFSLPRKVLGPLSFQVRLRADPARPDRLYVTWLRADSDVGLFQFSGTGNPILMTTSDDGGRSWSRAVRVSERGRERVVAPTLGFGPPGTLNVLYLDVGEDRLDYEGGHRGRGGAPYPGPWQLVLARSKDGGATWTQHPIADRIVPSERFIAFIPPYPSLAVDPKTGRAHAAFTDARDGDADVRVWTLDPGAAAWRGVRVNDTPRRDGTSQTRPQLAVAPNGRLDVAYYDRRADPDDIRTSVSLQSSEDSGRTFGPAIALADTAFDSRVGFGTERGLPDLGSRIALLSDDRRALAAWADTRAGTPASGKQDVAAAAVAFSTSERPAAGRTPLRVAGIAAVIAGIALLASALLAGRRRRSAPPPAAQSRDDGDGDDDGEQPGGDVARGADTAARPA